MSERPDRAALAREFAGTALEGAQIFEEIGRGRRSRVYRCLWNGRECALKIHEPEAAARHQRLLGVGLAQFEYERNLAFFRAPGLGRFVAEPLGFVSNAGTQVLAQERLTGEIYYEYYRRRAGRIAPSLAVDLAHMVEAAHAVGLFDMDLHAMNVMVVEGAGVPVPKLFDFNLIPFTVRPQNFLVGWLLNMGLMSARSRDLRRLKNFHDFRSIERRMRRHATEP